MSLHKIRGIFYALYISDSHRAGVRRRRSGHSLWPGVHTVSELGSRTNVVIQSEFRVGGIPVWMANSAFLFIWYSIAEEMNSLFHPRWLDVWWPTRRIERSSTKEFRRIAETYTPHRPASASGYLKYRKVDHFTHHLIIIIEQGGETSLRHSPSDLPALSTRRQIQLRLTRRRNSFSVGVR